MDDRWADAIDAGSYLSTDGAKSGQYRRRPRQRVHTPIDKYTYNTPKKRRATNFRSGDVLSW